MDNMSGLLMDSRLGAGGYDNDPYGGMSIGSYQRPGRRDLRDYFGNYGGYPTGASFEFTGDNSGQKRPRIEGNFYDIAPLSANVSKRARLGIQEGGLGGFMSEGVLSTLDSMTRGGGGGRSNAAVNRGFQFGMSPDEVASKSTIGFLSNPTIPANEMILKKMPNYELPGTMDLVIMRRHLLSERQYLRRHPLNGLFVDTTLRSGFTIPAFNDWLIQKQPVISTTQQYLNALTAHANQLTQSIAADDAFLEDPNRRWFIKTADDILRYFDISGVVDTENFDTNVSSVSYLDSGLTQQQAQHSDKKVNIVIYGRVDIFNLFGPGLHVGTPLYLIFKPKVRPVLYRTDSTRDMTLADVDRMTLTHYDYPLNSQDPPKVVTPVTTWGWQVEPWADNIKKHPTVEDVLYTDPLGNKGYGRAVCLGYVMKEDHNASDGQQNVIASDVRAIHSRSILDIYFTNAT